MSASGWLTFRYVCKRLAHIRYVCKQFLRATIAHSCIVLNIWLTFMYCLKQVYFETRLFPLRHLLRAVGFHSVFVLNRQNLSKMYAAGLLLCCVLMCISFARCSLFVKINGPSRQSHTQVRLIHINLHYNIKQTDKFSSGGL